MAFRRILGFVAGLAVLGTAYAGLDLSSNSTVAVYWGQNSLNGSGELAQQSLGYYCDDPNIDVIILAFLTRINGAGGAPEFHFSTASEKCSTFSGTNLKNCPEIGTDITTCQAKGKTVILSIGGATYTEGGFQSKTAAEAGADLLWATFGPPSNSSSSSTAANRPFGNATVDGFDFDFEASVSNIAPFASRLRNLADAETSRKYYLTAAPQCPYPDAANKDILNGNAAVSIDAVWVQFYNNFCGVNSFVPGQTTQNSFNFETWDKWASTESKNKKVKVFLGVPANTGAASSGYLPISRLEPVIEYGQDFASFGGVMMWDVTQAYGNTGFLDGVSKALGRPPAKNQTLQQPQQPASQQQQQQQQQATPTSAPSQVPQQQNGPNQAQQGQQQHEQAATPTPSPSPASTQQQEPESEPSTKPQQEQEKPKSPLDLLPTIADGSIGLLNWAGIH